MADAEPDGRAGEFLFGAPGFERIEEGFGNHFIGANVAEESEVHGAHADHFGGGDFEAGRVDGRGWIRWGLRLGADPLAVGARRAAVALAKGAGEGFGIAESAVEGDVEERTFVDEHAECRAFEAQTLGVGLGAFSDGGLEDAVEMEGGKPGFGGEGGETEIAFQVRLYVH